MVYRNKTIYFPALSGFVTSLMEKNYHHRNTGKSFRFYNTNNQDKVENKIFHHPYFLITAGYNHKSNIINKFDLSLENNIVLGDSGGFQIATGKLKNNWENTKKLFDWLENNTTHSMVLDVPPYSSEGLNNTKEEKLFQERLEKSYQNYKYFYENRSGKTKYLNVLHGHTLPHVEKWFNTIQEFDFTGGWAVGSCVGQSIYVPLLNFVYLKEQGRLEEYKNIEKPVFFHFLGYTTPSNIIYLFYLQRKLNEYGYNIQITYDSSSYSMSASVGNYYRNFSYRGIQNMSFSNTFEKYDDLKYIPLSCNCEVCKDITFYDIYDMMQTKGTKSEAYYYLGMHNLQTFINLKEDLENLMMFGNRKLFESYFKYSAEYTEGDPELDTQNSNLYNRVTNKSERIMKILDTIDELFESNSPVNIIESRSRLLKNEPDKRKETGLPSIL